MLLAGLVFLGGCGGNSALERRVAFLETRLASHERGTLANDDALFKMVNDMKGQGEAEFNQLRSDVSRLRGDVTMIRSKTDRFCVTTPSPGEIQIFAEGQCRR